jgi:hypothetical protein
MSVTEMIKPPPPPSVGDQRSATPSASSPESMLPTVGERLDEILPLIFFVPVAGPPVIVLLGPWLLLALMLTGPFLLLVTFALACVLLVVTTAAIVAPPYLLVRHLRRRSARRREWHTPVHRSRELPPIGVSLLAQRSDARLFSGPRAQLPAAAHLHNPAPTHVASKRP